MNAADVFALALLALAALFALPLRRSQRDVERSVHAAMLARLWRQRP